MQKETLSKIIEKEAVDLVIFQSLLQQPRFSIWISRPTVTTRDAPMKARFHLAKKVDRDSLRA